MCVLVSIRLRVEYHVMVDIHDNPMSEEVGLFWRVTHRSALRTPLTHGRRAVVTGTRSHQPVEPHCGWSRVSQVGGATTLSVVRSST